GGSVAISNNNNSTVQAASITLPAGYTKSAIIKWNQTGKASKALIDASKKGMKENTNSDAGSDNTLVNVTKLTASQQKELSQCTLQIVYLTNTISITDLAGMPTTMLLELNAQLRLLALTQK